MSSCDYEKFVRVVLFGLEKIVYCVFAYLGRCRNKSNDQQSSNDCDGQSENVFAFPSRRSYSRERLANSVGKVRISFKKFFEGMCRLAKYDKLKEIMFALKWYYLIRRHPYWGKAQISNTKILKTSQPNSFLFSPCIYID